MRKLVSMMLAMVMAFGLFGAVNAQSSDMARVRVAHASPDAPNVDVYANGNKVLSDVPFFTVSDYLEVPAGSYQFQVVVAGETDLSAAVIDATVDLAAGTDYTVAAVNDVANIEGAVLEDNNAAPAEGKAHVRLVHASPDAPAVDIRVAGGPTIFSNIAFGEVGDYTPVDAGTYDLEVVVAGTDTVALEVPGVALDAGTVYTVWATDMLDNLTPEITVDAMYDTAAAPTTPAPDTAPPADLPTTGAAETLPIALLAILAACVATAGIIVRRRSVLS